MTELSRSEKMLAEKTVCILLIRGENIEGAPIYAYVAIRADRLEEFMKAQEGGLFAPDEYGTILEAGEGEPSEEVKMMMRDEYGFNHDSMLDLGAEIDEVALAEQFAALREQQMAEDATYFAASPPKE